MDFALNEDQEMFRSYLRKYLDKVGQTKVAREFIKGNTNEFTVVMNGLAELGATAINIPEENEGLGLGAVDLVPVFEEMGRVVLPGIYLETMAFAVPLLEKYGTEEQKAKYLPDIAAGNKQLSLAWLEPVKDYSLDQIECAVKEEGETLVINGVKELVPDADFADAFIVVVRNSNDGLSLILVDRDDELSIRPQKCMDESRHLGEITFDEWAVPKSQLLGSWNQGVNLLEEGILYLNAGLSSLLVGGMEKVVGMATEYANIREQFGQPIGRFQAIKHTIVDMKMDLEMARSLSYYASWTLEEMDAEKQKAAVYSARAFATEAFIRLASENIQIHGGIGFTEEIDCHLFLKRARFYEHYLGSVRDYNELLASALGWNKNETSKNMKAEKVVHGQ
ncbi:acyl-CoA dehydrogenase [Virgibacillus phasianinus]|uniref:Acyl-CoA dehydrogenase n=1 Tax=Virgibacillus phasianinus TaxID=2017483 RepID=A0A220U2R9_9BACI|nr:acyl-CoA dehydrogenase family protein [Virgibacillus phasianinus]ASK62377.1 acyl-CoA dehydrogenase [Virgibacillus phasianinus]